MKASLLRAFQVPSEWLIEYNGGQTQTLPINVPTLCIWRILLQINYNQVYSMQN